MLYIDDKLPHVSLAKQSHVKLITCYLRRKLEGKTKWNVCADKSCKICTSRTRRAQVSKRLLSALRMIDLKSLIESAPADLIKIHKTFNRICSAMGIRMTANVKKSLGNIFNYDWFIDNNLYDAYELCKSLKIESCVYCNRLYTSTVITTKNICVIRPTLDHWFDKASHPILGLSFYNLIPSCSPCNSSVKHSQHFNLKKHIHPYVDQNMTKTYQLQSTYSTSLNTFNIDIVSSNPKVKATLKSMQIDAIYEHHQSELADLDFLSRKYNDQYLRDIGKLLGITLTEKDVYRILFGVEYDDENFYKRPLSKLKKDILGFKLK